jgi:hypothetical protein
MLELLFYFSNLKQLLIEDYHPLNDKDRDIYSAKSS